MNAAVVQPFDASPRYRPPQSGPFNSRQKPHPYEALKIFGAMRREARDLVFQA
jgi:hypothetical protein